ncbi:hypothetical protein [Cellulomonas cellasea]|uniref:Uncharacterized protein n=1 Tax=Cellulomonas cellasea TaxID=43670 RepID=A0A7W4UCD4_9CELL|nr:hypothetical protein [Cellulomonas cellasea]MBB2921597.1 hypothetical protein [Cellulomonas cellasea]
MDRRAIRTHVAPGPRCVVLPALGPSSAKPSAERPGPLDRAMRETRGGPVT